MNMGTFLFNVIIFPIVQIVEFIFVLAQSLFHVMGFSVIAVSIAITVLCLPLYAVAEQWQELERATQKRMKPMINHIKTTFKGDEQYMMLSAFYKEQHYHPIKALRSSFGLLIQIPFFIAAYSYLSHLEQLQGVSFLFLQDLGKPDALLHIGSLRIHLLPIAMTLINCISGTIYTRGFPLKEKVQLYAMALVFLLLLYPSPSGLVLYWTMNNVFSLVKNIYYKIPYKNKLHALFMLFAAVLLLLVAYLNITGRGPINTRHVLSFCLVLAAAALCFAPKIRSRIRAVSSEEVKPLYPLFFSAIALLALLFGSFVPTNLISASPQEFSYIDTYTSPVFFILFTFSKAVGFCIFWPVCFFFLFSNNVKKTLTFLFSFLAIAALINVFFFSGNYGYITTEMKFTDSVEPTLLQSLINALVLCIPVAGIFIMARLKKARVLITLFCLGIFSLFCVTLSGIVTIKKEFSHLEGYKDKLIDTQLTSVEPIVTLSKTEKNVIVLMLDRAISVLVPDILDTFPELRSEFSGFTFYPNAISFNGYTRLGAPPIFGGYDYTPLEVNKRKDVTIVQKRNEAHSLMPRLFSEHGMRVTATDLPNANGQEIPDMSFLQQYKNVQTYLTDKHYTKLWCEEHDFALPSESEILKRNILWYSLLKTSPLLLHESIYQGGNWCALTKNVRIRKTLDGYAVMDYLPKLTAIDNTETGAALIMVNNLTHEWSLLQYPDYVPALTVTQFSKSKYAKETKYSPNVAALKRLATYFAYLQEMGVYDNTRIILVSDHGPESNVVTHNDLPFAQDQFNAFLMVKDFNARGDMKTDMQFMTNADVPYLALQGIVDNPVNPFTNHPINMDAKKEPQYVAISGKQLASGTGEYEYILSPQEDFYVSDNIFEPTNWRRAQ